MRKIVANFTIFRTRPDTSTDSDMRHQNEVRCGVRGVAGIADCVVGVKIYGNEWRLAEKIAG
jgi:hypothetical protein